MARRPSSASAFSRPKSSRRAVRCARTCRGTHVDKRRARLISAPFSSAPSPHKPRALVRTGQDLEHDSSHHSCLWLVPLLEEGPECVPELRGLVYLLQPRLAANPSTPTGMLCGRDFTCSRVSIQRWPVRGAHTPYQATCYSNPRRWIGEFAFSTYRRTGEAKGELWSLTR